MDTHLLAGTVQSGGTSTVVPLAGARVTAYHATAGTPIVAGSGTTGPDGRFSLELGPSTGVICYATARLDGGVLLATIVGPAIVGEITINELTTVAAAFSMAQFAEQDAISGNALGLRIAAGMSENLVSPLTGQSSEVMLGSPNADETISLRATRALANLIAPSVNREPGAFGTLQRLATPPGGAPPEDTFQALLNIARNPAHNVAEIWRQARTMEPYQPALEPLPHAGEAPLDAWTLAVKVNRTGDDEYRMFGGPANIAWDRNGYAWITNNVFQGGPDSCDFIVVLQPDGKPADGANGTVTSPVVGGGLKGPGFGIDIDRNQNVWVGSFGWGKNEPEYIPSEGIVSKFDLAGNPAAPGGYVGNTCRVQAILVDGQGHVWLASYGTNSVVVFPDGDPDSAVCYPPCPAGVPDPPPQPPETPGTATFGLALARDEAGGVWVSYSGGLGWPRAYEGAVCRFRFENGALQPMMEPLAVGHSLKGIAADSHGNLWVASGADDTVYMVSRDGTRSTGYTGRGGISGPWSVAVDGNDDVWVANFGSMGLASDYTHAGVSRLAGVGSPSGLAVGEAISPASGYTLPSAGSPVMLPDGKPLYEHGECYSPLMRMTNVAIDQAGNVWAINNWKPRFGTDFPPGAGNPGGDGIVIFVGLAKPPAWPW
jgi:hypothetical protein